MSQSCEQCGQDFKTVKTHWSRSSTCDFPEFTDYQKDVIIGGLMGDGCIDVSGRKAGRFALQCIEKDYVEFISDIFPLSSVRMHRSAEENTQNALERGYCVNECKESWVVRFTHPWLTQLREEWYGSGKKVWPADVELTPTVLKHLYCGDGSLHSVQKYPTISTLNEVNNTDKIEQYFKYIDCPSPSRFTITGGGAVEACWKQDQVGKFFNYIGEPVPGYEYKWP